MSRDLLSLPAELVACILLHLPLSSLPSVHLSCRTLHTILESSISIQYNKWLEITGCIDNEDEGDSDADSTTAVASLSTKDKLALLQAKFRSWDHLALASSRTIQIYHRPSGIYDLTGGVYLLGSEEGRELYWVSLPDGGGGGAPIRWHRVPADKAIVDMGLCIYEHDLLGIVSTHPTDQTAPLSTERSQTQTIQLSFLHLPTNQPHRLAQINPLVIDTYTSPAPPAIALEIVGNHFVLVLSYSFRLGLGFFFHQNQHQNQPGPQDKVFIYNWKTGVLLAQFQKPARSYSSVVFLTPSLFLLPNARENQLEVYRIPRSPLSQQEEYKAEMILSLPRLSAERIISSISCRGEPAPSSSPSTNNHKKPFTSCPYSSIIIFNIRILPAEMFVGLPLLGNVSTLIIQRQSLIDLLHSLNVQNPSHIHTYGSWGPPITRWFTSSQIPTRWITTSASTRLVFIPSSAPDSDFGSPYLVCDFNPCAVKWTRKRKGEVRAVWMMVRNRLKEVVKGLRQIWLWEEEMREKEEEEGGIHIPGAWLDSEDDDPHDALQAQSDLDHGQFHIHSRDTESYPDPDSEFDAPHFLPSRALDLVPMDDPLRDEYAQLRERYDDLLEELGRMWTVGGSSSSNTNTDADADSSLLPPEFQQLFDDPSGLIRGSLPYAARLSPGRYRWDGVLMDEERVLGITTDRADRVQSVTVHYFG